MDDIGGVFQDAIGLAIRIAGPMLLLSMLVGVVVAILQAVTQIHEQTLSFLMKLIVVILYMVIGGGWMLRSLQDFTVHIFSLM